MEPRATYFLSIMIAIGAAGLAAFIIYLLARHGRRPQAADGEPGDAPESAPTGTQEGPSGVRLLGLLVMLLAFLLMVWLYVPTKRLYPLMLYFIYPAALSLAFVLLFDKASRSWTVKSTGQSLREWLYCDFIVVLFIWSYLNLLQSDAGEDYRAIFWDAVNIIAFVFVFWLIDRKFTRLRFLVAQGYLILLPILLLIWETVQEVQAPEDISWWSTIWPFFYLAIIAFVLEMIALIATRESEHDLAQTIKDFVFVILYGILLIVAIP